MSTAQVTKELADHLIDDGVPWAHVFQLIQDLQDFGITCVTPKA